jgi:transcriptional regulator with XRE-family HTH domain
MFDSEEKLRQWRQAIIDKLVQARIGKGLTQGDLARLVGMQPSNISRLENGVHNPSLDLILKIASALEMDINIGSLEEVVKAESNIYELRMYDETLLSFTLNETELEGLKAHIIQIADETSVHLPAEMSLNDEGLLRWLNKRVIPKNRTFVDEILKTLKLSANDTKGIIDICKGLSLNDSYWVVPQNFEGKFAKYNLYENRFSEMLSLVAYTGMGQSNAAFTTSPELTTNGMLPKAWRFIENEGIYLYKGGSTGAANTGNEPFSEYYASQIAQVMGLKAVRYELENWKGILASKCKLFTDIDTAFIPIGRIVTEGGLKGCLDYYKELGDDFYEQICSMLVFDAVIYNEDRHFGNFGLLRDNQSGSFLTPAPIFDNGLSLFNYGMPDDFNDLDEYAKTRSPAYRGTTFEGICKSVMNRVQTAQLRRLIGFEFTRHPRINLPEARLQAIEKHLQRRVRNLLALERAK